MCFFLRVDFCSVVPASLRLKFKYGTYVTDPRFPGVPPGVAADALPVIPADVGVASRDVESTAVAILAWLFGTVTVVVLTTV